MDDDVLARPHLRECRDARFCGTKGLRGFDEMRTSVASQLEDAKRQTQARLQVGNDLRGTVRRLSHGIWCVGNARKEAPAGGLQFHFHLDCAMRFNASVMSRMLAQDSRAQSFTNTSKQFFSSAQLSISFSIGSERRALDSANSKVTR